MVSREEAFQEDKKDRMVSSDKEGLGETMVSRETEVSEDRAARQMMGDNKHNGSSG